MSKSKKNYKYGDRTEDTLLTRGEQSGTIRRRAVSDILRERGWYEGIAGHIAAELGVDEYLVDLDLKSLQNGDALDDARNALEAPSAEEMKIHGMALTGHTTDQIQEEFGMNETSVRVAIQKCAAWIPRQARYDRREMQNMQVAKLEAMSDFAMRVFHHSREDAVTTAVKSGANGEERLVTRKGQSGDARFMQLWRELQKDIRETLGVDAPKKTALTNASGDGPVEIDVRLRDMTPEQIAQVAQVGKLLQQNLDE